MSRALWQFALFLLMAAAAGAPRVRAGNFTTGTEEAVKFGVHEVVLTGDGSVANPWDTIARVTFVPPSGEQHAKTVEAFYDGENTWRARAYVTETGPWRWSSACATDERLQGRSGSFSSADSHLRGRLLPHRKNPRQWITDDGRWFLNLSDTSYLLLCRYDGNGGAITDADALRYVADDVAHGITALRCNVAGGQRGAAKSSDPWTQWHFQEGDLDQLRLDNLQFADHRLRLLLDQYPDVAIQLTLFPLVRYAADDRFWTTLTKAQRERLLRHLVARFAAYPQLMWLIINDAHFGEKHPQNNAMAREAGAFLQEHDPWQHPRSAGHARLLPFVFGDEAWATYIHIEHKHDLGASQYAQYHRFAKPVFLGEDRYEQDHGPRLDPKTMRYWQRRLFWSWLLSGGSANYGGRWWVIHPYSETGKRETAYHARPDTTFRTALSGLDSVQFIRDFFATRKIELSDFEPDHALVSDGDGGGNPVRAPRLMRRGGSEFLVYHPSAAADEQDARLDAAKKARLRLDLRAVKQPLDVEWYSADDGTAQQGGTIEGGKFVEMVAPWAGRDVVVWLRPAADGYTSAKTFTYKTVGDLAIKADVYRLPAEDVRPALVWIHGGALITGRRGGPTLDQRRRYLDAGYVIVSIDYRLAPETKLPDILDDVRDAIAWVRAEGPRLYKIDPNRLAVVGHSAGGYLALMAGFTVEPRPRALVAFYGYGDVAGDWYAKPSAYYRRVRPLVTKEEAYRAIGTEPIAEGGAKGRSSFYTYCRQNGLWPQEVVGHDPVREPREFDRYCPVRNVTKDYPPTLLLHGDRDTDVPYEQSVAMAAELKRAGVVHELLSIAGGEHGFDAKGMQDPGVSAAFDTIERFLKDHVRK